MSRPPHSVNICSHYSHTVEPIVYWGQLKELRRDSFHKFYSTVKRLTEGFRIQMDSCRRFLFSLVLVSLFVVSEFLHITTMTILQKVKKVKLYSSSERLISEIRGVTCHMGSHGVTCHLTQLNTLRLNHSQRSVLDLPTLEGWKAELT